jgi:hypothetical protein
MITEDLIRRLRLFIQERYVPAGDYGSAGDKTRRADSPGLFGKTTSAMSAFIEREKTAETFSVLLDKLREDRGLKERDVYKKAWIDKRLSSKIMNSRHYHPSKNTAIAFGLALELGLDDFKELLESAGYALNRSSLPDLIIMFCVQNGIYDLHDVNAALVVLEQKPLCREPRD